MIFVKNREFSICVTSGSMWTNMVERRTPPPKHNIMPEKKNIFRGRNFNIMPVKKNSCRGRIFKKILSYQWVCWCSHYSPCRFFLNIYIIIKWTVHVWHDKRKRNLTTLILPRTRGVSILRYFHILSFIKNSNFGNNRDPYQGQEGWGHRRVWWRQSTQEWSPSPGFKTVNNHMSYGSIIIDSSSP